MALRFLRYPGPIHHGQTHTPDMQCSERSELAKSDPVSLTAPVSHQERPQQNATKAIDLTRKYSRINEPVPGAASGFAGPVFIRDPFIHTEAGRTRTCNQTVMSGRLSQERTILPRAIGGLFRQTHLQRVKNDNGVWATSQTASISSRTTCASQSIFPPGSSQY